MRPQELSNWFNQEFKEEEKRIELIFQGRALLRSEREVFVYLSLLSHGEKSIRNLSFIAITNNLRKEIRDNLIGVFSTITGNVPVFKEFINNEKRRRTNYASFK